MIVVSLPRLAVMMLLTVALPLWVAGAHVHLCSDGLEPPLTVHPVADAGDHAGHHAPDEQHSDSDVGSETSLTRTVESSTPVLGAASVVAYVSTGVQSAGLWRMLSAPIGLRTAPWSLQPPLRAPPA
jgi:hypothetical protein